MKKILISCIIICGLFLGACSSKKAEDLYNLSAIEWYQQIIKDLQEKNLEAADQHYTSMAAEHVADPLLEQTLLILAQAHISEEQYELANFYLDEYLNKFGDSQNIAYIRYLKIKAKFDSFAVPNRNQALMLQTIQEIQEYNQNYPNVQYNDLIDTMFTKFNLAIFYLDTSIAELYKKLGREESYEIYKEKLENSDFKNLDMIKPELPWYRKIFEEGIL
ncbi:outer membrane protein assembly factor BamD [Campylobacter volucris]|uniref:outer membrane protein assembly factor BamD n=1 Tax=Campylobacter volucris TaxID=1031542 RepID=UPI00189EACBC|nr:outer membrane protein assembly factor BamD [Campylobacter volucris]MBF7047534.1 outer membrane protein assembly factor BamD [Campylobacter volucris]MBF7049330.1 outer membrane protein assembly factor BamD [Campylobacter volucris]MBF7059699.1 outer membrane protein assembly factor BamD [Campylobacter volucris]MBF7068031.1 outer membrane protein assembly factor BamD [Campylobacter volucris]MBF7068398.1 outer membrane protein assembly factor BamD [Campylobacter volucris]